MINDRVFIALPRDSDGYPPWDEEEIWAEPLPDGLFRLDASPTFARGVSANDVVHVTASDDRWYVDSVVTSGGHSTLRVVLFDAAAHGRLHEMGRSFGSSVAHTEIQGLFAVDVPPDADFIGLREELRKGKERKLWDVDEGNLSHPNPP